MTQVSDQCQYCDQHQTLKRFVVFVSFIRATVLVALKNGEKAMKNYNSFLVLFFLTGIYCNVLDAVEPLQPAAHWSFNRCGEDTDNGQPAVLDGSGNHHHLRLSGVSCVTGRYGLGGSFDGVDDIALTEDGVLNFTDGLTVAAWVKPDVVTGVHTIVNKWYTMDSYSLIIGDGRYIFTVAFPDGDWGTTVAVSTPATAGSWTHVAGVFNGSTHIIRIYVNGNLKAIASTPAGPLQQSARPVAVGSHPSWNSFDGRIDEVALYGTAMTTAQIRNLASRDKTMYLGADTNTHAENDQYPSGEQTGYDFYSGRLGWAANTCRIEYPSGSGTDAITGDFIPLDERCQFQFLAAAIARPERTYGYWWLAGPNHADAGGMAPYDFGSYQAALLIQQRDVYRHIAFGRTLFADIEGQVVGGWENCAVDGFCSRNRQVLDGFLDTIAAASLTPGVYTNVGNWGDIFGTGHVPSRPFVLWLTSCDSYCGRSPNATHLNVVKLTILGGMKAKIWQYHLNCGDYDAMSRNPSSGFPATIFDDVNDPCDCTCQQIGGICPYCPE